ncbi:MULTISPECIES: hypothetical protein [unclassified Colwellia]|uniref:hypothetical protein n=1 Tax=unclassified Colwellia TaxID=196834 RepID=UPI0015F38933|nr:MULTISPECIES: hypothetical protein [unclassified Colwellia]MBA6231311.1 hypothetical protein [Colwellia sp. MB02u-7]MBA6235824.1 hypothetical protein [Colwellia sp. MB02u-11]MBA6258005.1 hypothetical protein [Colwellia sp. MB3u-28]MBA6258701.1 hypothetical protein [Colwellia sp. MB3u-41]MBA6297959.1 hypothetical protein [Colwellia sp. MB3u-22]
MELNSIDDVNALVEIQKIAQVKRLEKKIRQLGYLPLVTFVGIIVFYILRVFSGYFDVRLGDVIFIGLMIGGNCQSNVLRMDLIRELFKLQYGK